MRLVQFQEVKTHNKSEESEGKISLESNMIKSTKLMQSHQFYWVWEFDKKSWNVRPEERKSEQIMWFDNEFPAIFH